ncbi:hypothetical protein IWX49DRAFT_569768 [Phyllosticta citricarpa]|uniref:NAD(P)-binding domain-containing protein n=2 Tax=Phyllosticta TaxID=121621 RepID=A0ABR1LNB4_9PEZI
MATNDKKYDNVIVFGPTGDVGGHAALTASQHGAKVWLAMRNPSKAIPQLSHLSADEEAKSFTRVQADLTDAASILAAVQQSNAKAAYVYLVQTADALRSSLAAMKEGGIEYVVFLSSFSVPYGGGDVREVAPSHIIAFAHAAVEAALEDLAIPHVALRPAYFASNAFKMGLDAAKFPDLEANVLNGAYEVDCIAPDDIGRAAGALLVAAPGDLHAEKRDAKDGGKKGKSVFYLCGPQLVTQDRVFEIIGEVSGREVKVNHLSKDGMVERFTSHGMPRPVALYMAEALDKGFAEDQYRRDMYEQAVRNVEMLTGREAMRFEDYVRLHLDELVGKEAAAAVPGGTFSS